MTTYNFKFKNGTYSISKGVVTKFDWYVTVKLNDAFIMLDQRVFLTKKEAIRVTNELLNKYNLI